MLEKMARMIPGCHVRSVSLNPRFAEIPVLEWYTENDPRWSERLQSRKIGERYTVLGAIAVLSAPTEQGAATVEDLALACLRDGDDPELWVPYLLSELEEVPQSS